MAINQLYHNWITQIKQLRPKERITRVRNMAWLMTGIFESKSVHLSKEARLSHQENTRLKTPGWISRIHIRINE